MRLWQLSFRAFVAGAILQFAARLASRAGLAAATAVSTPLRWVVLGLAIGSVLIAAITVATMVVRSKRAARYAVPVLADDVTPTGIVESRFLPLVTARVVRDLAVGVVVGGETLMLWPGHEARPSREGRLYEVGSLTKPMTGEVLAGMVAQNRVRLADRLGDLLAGESLRDEVAEITLEELVTHHSGLARLPPSLSMRILSMFSSDPYRRLGRSALLKSLSRARRATAKGTYSNFGFGVLGTVLGDQAGGGYEAALREFVLEPLGLRDTHVDPAGDEARRVGRGHDMMGLPTPRWHANGIAGASGVCMTIREATQWLAAHLEPPDAYRPVIELATEPRAAFRSDRIAMAWIVREINGDAVHWHNGSTGGFSSFAAFNVSKGVGVVALSASVHVSVLDRAGFDAIARLGATSHGPLKRTGRDAPPRSV